jgi:hypothetical protein
MHTVEKALLKRIGRLQYRIVRIINFLANRPNGRRVVFLHIPKCAGTSVFQPFTFYFGSARTKYVATLDDREPGRLSDEKLKHARDALFVYGHFGFEILEKIRGDAFVFTMLRDPYDRLRSMYGYLRNRPKGPSIEMSLDEFLASRDRKILLWSDNVMARMLAARFERSSVEGMDHDALARLAIAHLDHFDHIGFVDSFNSDLNLVAATAGMSMSRFKSRANVTNELAGASPPEELVTPFNATIREMAKPLVKADLAVYEAARLRRYQMSATPGCSRKVGSFPENP